MTIYDFIIIDEDEEYSENLLAFIRKNYNNRFNVIKCGTEKLNNYLKNDNCILLIWEKIYEEQKKLLMNNQKLVFILSEKQVKKDKKYIFKYQEGDKIVKNIIGVLAEIHGDNYFSLEQDYKNVVGVYSPIGGVGKTTTSLILSSIIASHQKVFYLNLEYFPSINELLKNQTKYNFSDFIYYAMKEDIDLNLKVESIANKDNNFGFYYFNVHNTMEDIIDTDNYLWRKIIRTLSSLFDWVIIDFDSSYDEKNRELLEMCSNKIILGCDSPIAKEKLKKWYQYIKKVSNFNMDNNIFLANKCMYDREFSFFFKNEPDVVIDYDKNYAVDNLKSMLHGDFARKISIIYEALECKS